MSFSAFNSTELQHPPADVVPEEQQRIMSQAASANMRDLFFLAEDLLARYSHPYFMVRMAEILMRLRADVMALRLYLRAQSSLRQIGVVDRELDRIVDSLSAATRERAEAELSTAAAMTFRQPWKRTKDIRFPVSLPHAPPGHNDIRAEWTAATSCGSPLAAKYIRRLAIETNQLEGIFLLTNESMEVLVQKGIADGYVHWMPQSALRDPSLIKSILNDTVAAYEQMHGIIDKPESMTKDVICAIHSRLMRTCQISPDLVYLGPGLTRSITQKTVVITGSYSIQCCPFPDVDGELDYICRMAKQYVKTWRNPFATASWIHLILARCHPFQDGNGRLSRLIASIPLVRNGYPPISIALSQRQVYYSAINKAYEGDHSAFVQCVMDGMYQTITSVGD